MAETRASTGPIVTQDFGFILASEIFRLCLFSGRALSAFLGPTQLFSQKAQALAESGTSPTAKHGSKIKCPTLDFFGPALGGVVLCSQSGSNAQGRGDKPHPSPALVWARRGRARYGTAQIQA